MSSKILTTRILITLICLAAVAMLASTLPLATQAAPGRQSDAPLLLIETAPANGAPWAGGPVTFTFDQPLDPAAADAISVEPPLDGTISVQGETITFTPASAPEAGVRYRFLVDETAASASGALLARPVEITLAATGPLQVTATQPGDGVVDVSTDGPIVVVFSRPVAPLTGIDEQAGLPQPLTIDPAVDGQGQWISTSIYAFQPALGLAGGVEYTVTIADVAGLDGESLAEPVTFRFTTAEPIVLEVTPQGNQVPPDTPVQVRFSQPMDPESTAAAFSLVGTSTGSPVPVAGAITWDALQTTLTFSPTEPLTFGHGYTVRVEDAAQPASRQGNLRDAVEQDFDVVRLPAVVGVSPLDGATNVTPDANVTIRFSAPLSYTTVLPNISLTPTLTTTQVYSYYSDYNSEATLSWFKHPNTTYTVTVGGAIADPYGNTIGEDYSFSFTTGDYTPYTRINLDRFTHYSAYTETRVSVNYRNVDRVDAELYRVPISEFLKLSSYNEWDVWQNYQIPDRAANRIWSRSLASRVERNITGQHVISLTDDAGELLPPGLYLLEISQPQTDPPLDMYTNPTQALIVLSNQHLTIKKSIEGESLAWLTDLRTGEPVAGRSISFFLEEALIGEATTDTDGIATVALPLNPDNSYWPVRAITGEPGNDDFAVVSSTWSNGVSVWDFNLSGGSFIDDVQSHFYTDRPIYRPGQTVYWKGIFRLHTDEGFQLPRPGQVVHITVRDDRGNAIVETEYELNANGTLNGQVELAPTAITGFYYLDARMELDNRTAYGAVGFQVAAYRKPEFQIEVTPEQADYVQGETVRVRVQANYFSGGPLNNAPLTWRLIAEPYFFSWEGGPRDRYYSFAPYNAEQDAEDPFRTFFYGLVQEGSGVTDADGAYVIELPATLHNSLQSQRWAFDVTVQSATNQFVSGRATVPIHLGDYYIGLSPRSYVVDANSESVVDVVTLTPQGDRYAGAALEAIVYEYEWSSVYVRTADGSYRWQTSVVRTPVVTTTATTDRQGEAVITWTPERGGQYQIIARGEDEAGNAISSAAYVYVSDRARDAFVAWPRENNDRINLVADKQLYEPGETARILTPNPFTGPVTALVTLERGGVIEARVITLNSASETIDIPITADHIPNIFMGVVLVKGVDEANPFPSMRVGYVQINVDTAQKALTIDVSTSAAEVLPGETVTYTLSVADSAGQPVAGAEVSVAVVDKAVLSLAQGDMRSLLDIFYYQRPLGVTTGVLLSINKDRLSQQLSEGAKGGGGGPGSGLEIREDFPDIAFWRADLTTDANGQIVFAVALPDNLTTWSLTAKAITDETLVGEATYDVIATKALQVRPLLPRFFTAGDRARIGAVVVNTTAEAIDELDFTISVAGATLETTRTELSAGVDANGQARFDFPLAVGADAAAVVVTMTAQSPQLADAVRLEIPILRYETPEVVATAGSVPPTGVVEAIRVPDAATDNGDLTVTLEPSLAAGMLDGLTYLEHYPYECNEQTVSRFLPNLLTVRALRTLGIDNRALENQLAFQLGVGVQKLTSRQNADGGWGYWQGEESSPFISTYVLWGLHAAREQGFAVPERTLANAVSYLERQFKAPKDVEPQWVLNEMAFMNFVLSEMGQGDPGRASTLFDVRERLSHYGQALLAMTLANIAEAEGAADARPDARIDTLLDSLFGAVRLSATGASWHEESVDFRTLNTDIRTTSMVLGAFIRLDRTQPLLADVVRWLMSARKAGHWATTQENAWAIIALTDWLAATGELEADYVWDVQLNGAELGRGAVTPETVSEQYTLRAAVADLLRDEANRVQIGRSNASGQLYYTVHLRYYLDALAIESRDRGIVVDRRFEIEGQPVSSARVGEVISVTVTIVAPTDLHHALVEVPIPAGVEPIDPNLATTSDMFMGPTLEPTTDNQSPWRFWTPTYTDIRDDKVALFATYLRAGAYAYTFQARATTPGEYRVLPVYAEMMYFNEVWGRSAGAQFTVRE